MSTDAMRLAALVVASLESEVERLRAALAAKEREIAALRSGDMMAGVRPLEVRR